MLLNFYLFITLSQFFMLNLFAYEFKMYQEECMKNYKMIM
jgi:hypothetical protein